MTEKPDNQPEGPRHAAPDMASGGKATIFSLLRVWTLVRSTFTQLVRMKTFYFLIVFALFAFVWGQLNLQYTPEQKLQKVTEVSLGVMWVFSWLFAISATALLIPRDIEDRTLYTILAKPVSRLEYLVGKLGGVLLTIAISLLIMHLIFSSVLGVREFFVIGAEEARLASDPQMTPQERVDAIESIRRFGVRWELGYATFSIFLQSAIIASIALLISTFASSTLFSIIISVMVFVIAHFHKLAIKYWVFQSDGNAIVQTLGKGLGLFLPDLSLFDINLAEAIFKAEAVALSLVGELTILAGFYVLIYLGVALYLFIDKEF